MIIFSEWNHPKTKLYLHTEKMNRSILLKNVFNFHLDSTARLSSSSISSVEASKTVEVLVLLSFLYL